MDCGWALGAPGGLWHLKIQIHMGLDGRKCCGAGPSSHPIQLDGLLLAVAGLGVWCLYAPNATMCGLIVAGCFRQVVEGGVWMFIYIRVNWKAVVWCRSNPPHKLGWTVAGCGRFGLVVFVCTK